MNRLPNDEIIDEINIKIVPRFKSSGLSGEEWRTSAKIELKRKGKIIYQRGYLNIKSALTFLPVLLIQGFEEGLFELPSTGKDGLCMQPGCAQKATTTMIMKHRYHDGYQLPDESWRSEEMDTRVFCDEHAYRGDSDFNDCHENYIVKSDKIDRGNISDQNVSIPERVLLDARDIDMDSEEGQKLFKQLLDDAMNSLKESDENDDGT